MPHRPLLQLQTARHSPIRRPGKKKEEEEDTCAWKSHARGEKVRPQGPYMAHCRRRLFEILQAMTTYFSALKCLGIKEQDESSGRIWPQYRRCIFRIFQKVWSYNCTTYNRTSEDCKRDSRIQMLSIVIDEGRIWHASSEVPHLQKVWRSYSCTVSSVASVARELEKIVPEGWTSYSPSLPLPPHLRICRGKGTGFEKKERCELQIFSLFRFFGCVGELNFFLKVHLMVSEIKCRHGCF